MTSVGEQIREARKQKGLTQEQLAEKVNRNLRTIQRIENSKNVPGNETLQLICAVLEINLEEDCTSKQRRNDKAVKIANRIVHWILLIPVNLAFIGVFGWATVAHDACWPSVFSAYLLSFLIPHFIALYSPNMNGLERLAKFGIGLIFLLGVQINSFGIAKCMFTILPCTVVFCMVLFYGNEIISVLRLKNGNDK